MKKFLLTLCACAIVGTMSAQDLQKAKLYVPEFDTETAEGIFGTIYGVSANGMYAAGYDDFLGSCAFIWERSTGKFTEVELASMIMDASNDGTFVGNYWVEIPGTDGSVASRPGYYKDGVWSPLPLLRAEAMLTPGVGESDDMNGCAMAISADAKFIGGYITDEFVYKLYPALWQLNEETNEYELINTFENIQESIDTLDCPYGWVVKGMSDDGTILTGFAEWGSGARSAAVIINGEEKRLTCLKDPMQIYEETGEDQYLDAEGFAQVSANGQYFAGFYAASASSMGLCGWTWDPSQESVAFTDDYTVIACVDNNGVAYGSSMLMGDAARLENGVMTNLSEHYTWEDINGAYLSTIFACNNDGSVLGGIAMVSYSAFGGVQSPAVLVIGESDAVETIEKDANEVAMYNGWAFISGAYNEARVYNMQGVVVAEANEGNIDLTNVPAGVYIVNVDGASFKVVK
ncbi:MAG: T9SS type A sorting domain-containing protein [Bacteroidaceae bacterium]|nr:T9SS type A sorting domain-containing protein [Bacteroidaceae bacterium]